MAKTYENTFGTRIKNAEDTVIIISSFTNFKPLVSEDAPAELTKLINDLKTADQAEATTLQTYSVSTGKRTDLITKDKHSLKKSVSPIRAYLQAILDKEDKQFVNVNNILNQIRGFKPEKEKKNPDEKSISTSQQSYASLTQAFSDLIATLQTLNPPYKPTNDSITIEKLKEKHQAIEQASSTVTTSQNSLKDARTRRNELALDLSKRLKRIKKSVQSQYGNDSAEYAKLKPYRF
jgi:hypothetical protein